MFEPCVGKAVKLPHDLPFVIVVHVCRHLCVNVSEKVGISWECGCTTQLHLFSVMVFNEFSFSLAGDIYCYSHFLHRFLL